MNKSDKGKSRKPRNQKVRENLFNEAALRKRILEIVRESDVPLTKSQIGRILDVKGEQRGIFKRLIQEMQGNGELDRGSRRRLVVKGFNPVRQGTVVAEIVDVDEDGELFAEPLDWDTENQGPTPRIRLIDLKPSYREGRSALGVTSRIIVRLVRQKGGVWLGEVIRRVVKDKPVHIGYFQPTRQGGSLSSVNRKDTFSGVHIHRHDCVGLESGDVVQYSVEHGHDIKIIKRLGKLGDPHIFSQIAIHNHNIPSQFSAEAIEIAQSGKVPSLGKRADFRNIPLVTIDGEDARDFDDAVWATADADPRNEGGWRAIVAIADVSYYVRPDTILDREARQRGNSVYFPDRVVPMLPEALSNELCSLKPDEDRACLAIEMIISAHGKLKSYRVKRGLMRSAARLTYTQVQKAIDGEFDSITKKLSENVIKPLYGCYQSLLKARNQRGTLDLDVPEHQVIFNQKGEVKDIVLRERYDSHKLIEEFMIAANVAAAKTLIAKNWPCLFRIHDSPDALRVASLRQFLKQYRLKFPKTDAPSPAQFNTILHQVDQRPYERLIHELILRSQAQAKYSPQNIGHFGLSLPQYAHFTSPIRRYADLVVHRSLIGALELGEGGYAKRPDGLESIGDQISATERVAAAAEREVMDRYAISFVSQHVGDVFDGVIVAVNRAGLFVELPASGAEGFVPKRTLEGMDGANRGRRGRRFSQETFTFDEINHRMLSRHSKKVYQLGDKIQVILVEANTVTNSLIFQVVEDT